MWSRMMLVLVLCAQPLAAIAYVRPFMRSRERAIVSMMAAAVPNELTSAYGSSWAALCSPPISSMRADGAELMERVLGWLPEMLVALDIGDEDGEDDDDFVAAARPWLHTDGFGVVQGLSLIHI